MFIWSKRAEDKKWVAKYTIRKCIVHNGSIRITFYLLIETVKFSNWININFATKNHMKPLFFRVIQVAVARLRFQSLTLAEQLNYFLYFSLICSSSENAWLMAALGCTPWFSTPLKGSSWHFCTSIVSLSLYEFNMKNCELRFQNILMVGVWRDFWCFLNNFKRLLRKPLSKRLTYFFMVQMFSWWFNFKLKEFVTFKALRLAPQPLKGPEYKYKGVSW